MMGQHHMAAEETLIRELLGELTDPETTRMIERVAEVSPRVAVKMAELVLAIREEKADAQRSLTAIMLARFRGGKRK